MTKVEDTDRVDLFKVHTVEGGVAVHHVSTASFIRMVHQMRAMNQVTTIRGRLAENGGVFIQANDGDTYYLDHVVQRFEDDVNHAKMSQVLTLEEAKNQSTLPL